MTSTAQTTVLVVEDDQDIADGMAGLLEEEGFRVLCAGNGAEALAKLRQDGSVQLILLDLTMPVMSAAEFRAQQSRDAAIAKIPVLLLSAGLDVAHQAKVLGAAGYISKPFKPPVLIESMRRLTSELPS